MVNPLMAKLTLASLTSSYRSNAALNANFDAIEAAIENTLSRDGTSPNAMAANLDMGSNLIVNLADPTAAQEGATKNYVDGLADTIADINAITHADGVFVVSDGTDWVGESGATARASLGLTIGTDVQAYDAGLQDISGLATTDGNIIVGDGANWVAESGATARTSLGLAIGTDVQAYDAGLTSIAGLTTAADKMIYTTSSDTYAVTDLSSFARTVLDDATAKDARTTLEVNSKYVATISALKALTGGDFEMVEVGGHTAANDGGGGLFIWDGSDTTTDDNGIYIQPNAGGVGRWIRHYVGPVNLKWFGPAGDGVTDDTSIISASYLNKTLPIGEHLSSASAQTVADKGSLAGVTTAQSRIKRDALGGNLLSWSGVDYLDIKNFTIDLQFSSNGDEGHGIVLIDTDYVNVENVDITDFGNNGGSAGSGIISYISGHTYNKAVRFNNLRIDGDTATSTDTNGALIVDGRYCMMTDLFVENIISFAIEYKEDTRYSLIGDSIAHNADFGVGYGQSSAGDDGCDWNVAGNVVCHACDQGIIVGEGDYNLFSGFVIDSTGASGTDIYGVHFSTDATGNAAFGVLTHGANMDYAVRYRADNCYVQIVSHDTSPNVVTLNSGATRNVTEIAHPGARNSIEGAISDSSGNDILGSAGNPTYCHATGEYIGSLSGAWKWKAGESGASFLSSHVWRYENDGAAVLAFGVPDGNVAGFTVNTDGGSNAGSMFFSSNANPASEYWYMVVGGATSYRWYGSTFRPNADNSIDLGTSSVRWQDVFGYTGDFTTQVKVGGTKVVGAQGAAVADTTITYTTNDPAITPNDAVTIADGSAPTNSELLELCVELKNQIETLKGRLEAHGLIA